METQTPDFISPSLTHTHTHTHTHTQFLSLAVAVARAADIINNEAVCLRLMC